jgi:hypothetical protein
MVLLCIRSHLKSGLGYTHLILDTCHLDTTFISAGMWGSVVIFRNQKGSPNKNIWKTIIKRNTLYCVSLREPRPNTT